MFEEFCSDKKNCHKDQPIDFDLPLFAHVAHMCGAKRVGKFCNIDIFYHILWQKNMCGHMRNKEHVSTHVFAIEFSWQVFYWVTNLSRQCPDRDSNSLSELSEKMGGELKLHTAEL